MSGLPPGRCVFQRINWEEIAMSKTSGRLIGLSPRENDVLELMARGKSNKVICRMLNLAEPTVRDYVTTILRFFGATNRTEAVLIAIGRGWNLPEASERVHQPATAPLVPERCHILTSQGLVEEYEAMTLEQKVYISGVIVGLTSLYCGLSPARGRAPKIAP
jgi:DNA-binding CsgD family transcriptional regulator